MFRGVDFSPTDRLLEEEALLMLNLIFKPECVRGGDTPFSNLAFLEGEGLVMASGSGESISSCVMEVLAKVLAMVGVVWFEAAAGMTGWRDED